MSNPRWWPLNYNDNLNFQTRYQRNFNGYNNVSGSSCSMAVVRIRNNQTGCHLAISSSARVHGRRQLANSVGVLRPFPPRQECQYSAVSKTIQLKLNCKFAIQVVLLRFGVSQLRSVSVGFCYENRGFGSVYFLAVCQHFYSLNSFSSYYLVIN